MNGKRIVNNANEFDEILMQEEEQKQILIHFHLKFVLKRFTINLAINTIEIKCLKTTLSNHFIQSGVFVLSGKSRWS